MPTTATATATVGVPEHCPRLIRAQRHVVVIGGAGRERGLALTRELAAHGADWRVVEHTSSLASRGIALDLEDCSPGTVVWCFGPTALVDAVRQAHVLLPFLGPLHVEQHEVMPAPRWTVRPLDRALALCGA